jgi:hypothetical protein
MDRRQIVVTTGLDERAGGTLRDGVVVQRTRHARTRFVEREKPVVLRDPEPGDRWCALTVRARLERMGEVYRRLPHSPDTRPQPVRSCMPEPLRELFKDLPPAPLRPGVADDDLAAANQIVDVLAERERGIAWAIANRMSDRELGRHIGCHHATAANRKQDVLARLASHWNGLGWRPDDEDIRRARQFVHRNFY